MEAETDFTEQLNRSRLEKAYLRLSAEAKKIKESPGVVAIRGEPEKPKRKVGRPKKAPPAEQLSLF